MLNFRKKTTRSDKQRNATRIYRLRATVEDARVSFFFWICFPFVLEAPQPKGTIMTITENTYWMGKNQPIVLDVERK